MVKLSTILFFIYNFTVRTFVVVVLSCFSTISSVCTKLPITVVPIAVLWHTNVSCRIGNVPFSVLRKTYKYDCILIHFE